MPFKIRHGADFGAGWFEERWHKGFREDGPIEVAADGHECYSVRPTKPKDWVSRITPVIVNIFSDGRVSFRRKDSAGEIIEIIHVNGAIAIDNVHHRW